MSVLLMKTPFLDAFLLPERGKLPFLFSVPGNFYPAEKCIRVIDFQITLLEVFYGQSRETLPSIGQSTSVRGLKFTFKITIDFGIIQNSDHDGRGKLLRCGENYAAWQQEIWTKCNKITPPRGKLCHGKMPRITPLCFRAGNF